MKDAVASQVILLYTGIFCNTNNKGNSQTGTPAVKLFHTELLHFDLKDMKSQLCNENRALQSEN